MIIQRPVAGSDASRRFGPVTSDGPGGRAGWTPGTPGGCMQWRTYGKDIKTFRTAGEIFSSCPTGPGQSGETESRKILEHETDPASQSFSGNHWPSKTGKISTNVVPDSLMVWLHLRFLQDSS